MWNKTASTLFPLPPGILITDASKTGITISSNTTHRCAVAWKTGKGKFRHIRHELSPEGMLMMTWLLCNTYFLWSNSSVVGSARLCNVWYSLFATGRVFESLCEMVFFDNLLENFFFDVPEDRSLLGFYLNGSITRSCYHAWSLVFIAMLLFW